MITTDFFGAFINIVQVKLAVLCIACVFGVMCTAGKDSLGPINCKFNTDIDLYQL